VAPGFIRFGRTTSRAGIRQSRIGLLCYAARSAERHAHAPYSASVRARTTLSRFPSPQWSAGRRRGFARPPEAGLARARLHVSTAGVRTPRRRRARYDIGGVAKPAARTLRLPALHQHRPEAALRPVRRRRVMSTERADRLERTIVIRGLKSRMNLAVGGLAKRNPPPRREAAQYAALLRPITAQGLERLRAIDRVVRPSRYRRDR
jgi:hypothetical protein